MYSSHLLAAVCWLQAYKMLCHVQIEDRPIVKEVKTYIREHHPVEKEFVVETRPTGMFHCLVHHGYLSVGH